LYTVCARSLLRVRHLSGTLSEHHEATGEHPRVHHGTFLISRAGQPSLLLASSIWLSPPF